MAADIEPDLSNVPRAMRERQQWLLWRYEPQPGKTKPLKVPYYVGGKRRAGKQGDDADRVRLATFDRAKEALERGNYTGLGFAFLPGDGLAGIDIDHAINTETGEVSDLCSEIIALVGSYTELSPSGSGVHIIVETGDLDFKTFKSNAVGVEVFRNAQFFTVTGRGDAAEVVQLSPEALQRLREIVKGTEAPAVAVPAPGPAGDRKASKYCLTALDAAAAGLSGMSEGGRNKRLNAEAYALAGLVHTGGISESMIRAVLGDAARRCGLGDLETQRTLDSGIAAGLAAPRAVPDLPQRHRPEPATKTAPPAEGADVPEDASTPLPVSDGGGEPDAEKPKKQRKKKPAVNDDGQDGDDGGESWRDRLLYRKGELLDCRENIYLIVRHHEVFAGLIAYNEFAHRIERCGALPWTAELGEWETADDYKLGLWMAEHMGMPIRSEGTLAAGVAMAAMDCKFHPVRRYLDGLQWDGIDRLDHWLHECLSTRDDTYHKMIGRFFIMGMVARILNPGCQMDTMMILEGAQGRRKSTALRVLAGEWFADTPLKIGDKDATLNLSGVWLYEVAELDAFSKVEVTAVKQYVTSRVDRVREPYARRAIDRPRSCVFGGTTNQDEYLRDPSGGRRFWPVRVRMDIELGKLAEWRDQLYAEAMRRLQQGERYHPTREESEQYIVPEQEEREIADPWFERIAAWLGDKSDKGGYYDLTRLVRYQYTSTQILTQCLGVETHKIDGARQMATRVGVAMHKLGWRKVRDSGGLRLWRYLRPGFTQSGVQILGEGGESVQPSNTPPVEVGRV